MTFGRKIITTIVCNKEEMACDLQMTISGAQKMKCKTKIFKFFPDEKHFPEPFIVGFSGDASEIMDVVDFYEHPEIYQKEDHISENNKHSCENARRKDT